MGDVITSASAEEATKRIDAVYEKYDHRPPHTPTPTHTMTPTPSATMTPTPSATMTPTPSATMTPTITWTVYQESLTDVADFVKPTNGTQVDLAVCPCTVDGATENTYIFAVKRYDKDMANKTLVINGQWYEIVSSYTTFSKDILNEDGETTTQLSFFMNNTLVVPKNTDIDMYILFDNDTFFELAYDGGQSIYNIPESIVPANHDPTDEQTYIRFTKHGEIQMYGYRLLKQRESRIAQSVEDVAPRIGFTIETNDYAYTYVAYIGITNGTDNIEIDMITKNDVLLAFKGDSVVGVSSIRTTTQPSRIAIQIHTNTTEYEHITFKLLKHANLFMYTLGGIDVSIQGITHVFRVGYTRKDLKAPYDYISVNSGSTRSMIGTYLKSIIQDVSAVRSREGILVKTGNGFVGTLLHKSASYTLSVNTFYILTLSTDVTWEYVGTPLLNKEITYAIEEGENWISYPGIEGTSFEEFTNTFAHLDTIRNQEGLMTYESDSWIGDITSIEPNEGYIVSSTRGYDVITTTRQYSTVPVQIKTQFTVLLDDIPAEIIITDATHVQVSIRGVSFACTSKQDQSYYDSNLLTVVPTLFESTNDAEVVIGQYTGEKIKGVLSFALTYSNGVYDTDVSGFIDVYVRKGDTDIFTGDDPEMSWMSDIRGDNGYEIKNI